MAAVLSMAAAAAAIATGSPTALAQLDGSEAVAGASDEFNALLAETVADVFGRTIDEITEGVGAGVMPPTGGAGGTGQDMQGGGTGGMGGSPSDPRGIDTDVEISLHIPPKMIVGVQYEGMLFIDEPREIDMPVVIVVDGGTRVDVPSAVVIPAGDNHAMFPIRADDVHDHAVLGATQTTLTFHAIPPIGEQAMADTIVYLASFKAAALHIAAPTGQSDGTVRTITGHVPVRIILVDSTGVPIDAERDTMVHLTSSSSTVRFAAGTSDVADISVPIRAGMSSVDATISVYGDATVYAAAPGLKSDSVVFDHDDRDIVVRLGLAPKPAVLTTVGYYYVWLEKGGSLYIPDGILDVRMSSSDSDRVRFTPGTESDTYYDLMEGGITRGLYYVVGEGIVDLSASVAGYGIAQEPLEVRPRIPSERVKVGELWEKMNKPDTLRLWVYPDTPADHAWGVVGTYTTPFDRADFDDSDTVSASVVVGDNSSSRGGGTARQTGGQYTVGGVAGFRISTGDIVRGCTDTICPVYYDDAVVAITSDGGLRHTPLVSSTGGEAANPSGAVASTVVRTGPGADRDYRDRVDPNVLLYDKGGRFTYVDRHDRYGPDHDHYDDSFPVSAIEFPIHADTITQHTVTVSADDMESDTVEFTSRTAYGFEGTAMITPIPSRMDDPTEIAFVSIMDETGGYIVKPGATHRPDDARVIQTGGTIDDLEIGGEWIGGTAILRGTFTDEHAEVFVQVPGLHSQPVPMTVPGAHTGIEAWLPPRVNVGEPFPVTVHTVNDNGVPVEAILDASVLRVASGDVDITGDGAGGSLRMTALGHGNVQFNVVSDGVFAATRPIESFVNPHEADVSVGSPTPEVISLGENIVIDVQTGSIAAPHVSIEGTDGLAFLSDPSVPGRYVATPSEPGTYSVGVSVAGDGWDPYEDSLAFSVEEFVQASYMAIADDGVSVPSTLILTALTVPEDGTLQVPNGGGVSVHPGIFEAAIDESITIGGDRIYGLTGLSANDEPIVVSERFTLPVQQDTVVRATYQRGIDIDFAPIFDSEDPDVEVAVTGSGSYRYGESVILEAVPAPEMYGLVWHMPESWGGLPEDAVVSPDKMTATFEALETAVGSVEFRRDYGIMTLLIVVGIIAGGVVVWRKAPADTIYNIQDGMLNVGGRLSKIAERPKPSAKKGRRKKGSGDDDAGDDGEEDEAGGEDGPEDGDTEGDDDDSGDGKKAKPKKEKKKKGSLGGGLRSLIRGGDED